MLLRILKSNTLFSALLIPLIGILFWIHNFQTATMVDLNLVNGAMPLYYLVFSFFKTQTFWQVFSAFVLVIFNSFFIAQMGSGFLFLKKRSYLPGIIYLVTVSSLHELQALLPVHMATLFVLISIYFIFDTFHKKVEITYTFNAAFFLAIGSLFYLPVVVLFPLVWISIFVLQKDDNWRLLAVPVLGFGVPWLFIWVYSFLTDAYAKFWNELITMLWSRHNDYLLNPYFLAFTAIVAILTTLGSLSVISHFLRMKVSSRKYFVIFFWMLGLLLASALGLLTIDIEIVALSTIPVAYIVSNYLLFNEKTILKEVFLWIYLATAVFVLIFYV